MLMQHNLLTIHLVLQLNMHYALYLHPSFCILVVFHSEYVPPACKHSLYMYNDAKESLLNQLCNNIDSKAVTNIYYHRSRLCIQLSTLLLKE